MSNNNKIRVLAVDTKHSRDPIKLTDKQWGLYYYLLSISKYNPTHVDVHRYVYKNSFKIIDCCKFLGITKPTYYNSIQALKKNGIIVEFKDFFTIAGLSANFADVNLCVLKGLLSLRKYIGIDLLRIYLIFLKLQEIDNRKFKVFTKRDIIEMLGHNSSEEEHYYVIDVLLNILRDWELIDFEREKKTYNFGILNVYVLNNVNKKSKYLEELSNEIDMELKLDEEYVGVPPQIKEQIKSIISFNSRSL